MLLGDLINRLHDDALAEEVIVSLGSLTMLAEMRSRATAEDLALGEFTASTVRRYLAGASDDEWTTLISAMERATDPGAACLRRALAHA